MKVQQLAVVLTVVNLLLLVFLFAQGHPTLAQRVAPVLRDRALEIVDDQGRVRASITVNPPVTVDSQPYPESVVLRLSDPKSGPVVKIDASEEGSGLGLSDDSPHGGVRLMAKNRTGTFLKVTNKNGLEQVIKP